MLWQKELRPRVRCLLACSLVQLCKKCVTDSLMFISFTGWSIVLRWGIQITQGFFKKATGVVEDWQNLLKTVYKSASRHRYIQEWGSNTQYPLSSLWHLLSLRRKTTLSRGKPISVINGALLCFPTVAPRPVRRIYLSQAFKTANLSWCLAFI